jgi:hypothetical protein
MAVKKVALDGIGNDELVLILKKEFKALPEQEQSRFQKP